MRPSDAMRAALYDVQASALDHFGSAGAGRSERNDMVVVPMDDEGWHINAFQALAEVFVPGCDTGHTRTGRGRCHRPPRCLDVLRRGPPSKHQDRAFECTGDTSGKNGN